MALTENRYTATTGQQVFPVSFPYLDAAHVKVTVNGNPTTFGWDTAYAIRLPSMMVGGETVVIRRETPLDAPLVDFASTAVIAEEDLDTAVRQSLYAIQEAYAKLTSGITLGEDGTFNALLKRIRNIGAPMAPDDAATKRYVDGVLGDSASPIVTAKRDAEAARDVALAAKAQAEEAATKATSAANGIGDVVSSCEQARDAAQGFAGLASNYAQLAQVRDYGGLTDEATPVILDYGSIALGV